MPKAGHNGLNIPAMITLAGLAFTNPADAKHPLSSLALPGVPCGAQADSCVIPSDTVNEIVELVSRRPTEDLVGYITPIEEAIGKLVWPGNPADASGVKVDRVSAIRANDRDTAQVRFVITGSLATCPYDGTAGTGSFFGLALPKDGDGKLIVGTGDLSTVAVIRESFSENWRDRDTERSGTWFLMIGQKPHSFASGGCVSQGLGIVGAGPQGK